MPFSLKRLWLYLYREVFSTHSSLGTGQKLCEIDEDFSLAKTTEAFELNEDGQPIQTGDYDNIIPPKYQMQQQSKIYLRSTSLNIRRQVELLRAKLTDPRYDFIFNLGENYTVDYSGKTKHDLDDLLKEWIGEKNISVLDLSGIPNTILKYNYWRFIKNNL